MKYLLTTIVFFTKFFIFSQIDEKFTDGDFYNNPVWSGDDSVFTVVDDNGNFRLRSNKLIASSTFCLSTAHTYLYDAQWEFYLKLNFNTSSANYVDIYLNADQSNLVSASLTGYFVRVGGSADEICLYKKSGGTATKIIDGADGTTNASSSTMKIKVICSSSGDWSLERDLTATGNSYVSEGSVNDVSITTTGYFGWSITQSTSSFFQDHYLDDIYVGPIIYDVTPPVLLSANAVSATQVDVQFDEPLEVNSAQNSANYQLNPAVNILNAQQDPSVLSLVHLTLSAPLTNGTTYQLTADQQADLSGNYASGQTVSFTYMVAETPLPGDVIINEFLCDETPVVGLPAAEFVEIYNRSNKYFNLQGWKLGDNASDGTIQSGWLAPGGLVVLCATANVDSFSLAIAVTSFPSLNNSGDDIVLKDPNGIVLDKITYSDDWYHDATKEDGGYSIERVNPLTLCTGEANWKASTDPSGGTPAAVNAVYDLTPDATLPEIISTVAYAPNYLDLYFSEGMDTASLQAMTITSSPALTVQNRIFSGFSPTGMAIAFNETLVPGQYYQFTLEHIADCWQNTTTLHTTFVLPQAAASGDLVLNELLFNPYTNGSDWVEIYNNSEKAIDLFEWELANFSNDTIANNKQILTHFIMPPNGYAVVGKDSLFVLQNYPAAVPGTFIQQELPSYNNDSGTVFLIKNGQVMDAVSYSEKWQFKLLDDVDGVSLERLNPNDASNASGNWHSAAEAVGWGTPGRKNSQYYPAVFSGDFSLTSDVISPDDDGYEDVLQLNYKMAEPDMLGKLTIFSASGQKVVEVFNNELLGMEGTFVWDGVTEEDTKAAIGIYVAVFEAFDINGGQVFAKKKAFTVAGKL